MLRERFKRGNGKKLSTNVRHWGGLACSSVEVAVMVMEQRGWISVLKSLYNSTVSLLSQEDKVEADKTIYDT